LTKILNKERKDIIEWSNGQVIIHDPFKLESDVLYKYFRHSKYSSFQRQMNNFGFSKITGKGKMSPCRFVNNSTTSDMRSLLSIKRKPCVRPTTPRANDNCTKRKTECDVVAVDLKKTKAFRVCSDFSSETSTQVSITQSLTSGTSVEDFTFKVINHEVPRIPPHIMYKPIAVGTLGEMNSNIACALMPCKNTMRSVPHLSEDMSSSLKTPEGDTSFDAINFCASLNSAIRNSKQKNETDTNAGQCTSNKTSCATPHFMSLDKSHLLLDQQLFSKFNSTSVSDSLSLEPTPISEIISNHFRL